MSEDAIPTEEEIASAMERRDTLSHDLASAPPGTIVTWYTENKYDSETEEDTFKFRRMYCATKLHNNTWAVAGRKPRIVEARRLAGYVLAANTKTFKIIDSIVEND